MLAVSATAAAARDKIQVAGSSTVLPYATIVAEAFAENMDFTAPVVEGGGTGAGLKQFCAGLGENTIDVANASRQIKPAELAECRANGINNIMEVRFGYDGIVFASALNGADFVLTPQDVHRALAAEVVVDGKMVANPATTWAEVNPALPAQEITVYVPGTKHGTREVFEEKVMAAGCEAAGALEAMTPSMSTERPSPRSATQASSAWSASDSAVISSSAPEASQPAAMTFSSKTSRVPCLVPGT